MNATTMALMCIGAIPLPVRHEPPPVFQKTEGQMSYSERRKIERDQRQADLLDYLRKARRGVTRAEIDELLGISRTISGNYLMTLRDEGLVKTTRKNQTFLYWAVK